MRRPLTIAFLTALLVLVGAPAVIGQVAQARQAALLDGLAHGIARSRAETAAYDAGWFGSTARHRLVFDDPAYLRFARDLFGDETLDSPPALVIDSRIVHGPWPGLDTGPGLARIRSTLRIEAGPHGLDVPGDALTRIDLDGGGVTVFSSAGLIHEDPGGQSRIVWNGGRIEVAFDRALDELDSEGDIGAIAVNADNGELVIGPMTMQATTSMSEHGFRTGVSELRVGQLRVSQTDGIGLALTDISLAGRVTEEGQAVGHAFTLDVAFKGLGPLGVGTLRSETALSGLDAAAYGRIMTATSRGEEAPPGDLHLLLAGSPVLELSRFELDSAEGDVAASLRLWLAPAAAAGTGLPTAGDYLRRLGAEGRVEIGAGIVAAAAAEDPRAGEAAGTLVAMGYLRQAEGGYEMRLAYGGGLLTVNGLPVPLPAGVLSR